MVQIINDLLVQCQDDKSVPFCRTVLSPFCRSSTEFVHGKTERHVKERENYGKKYNACETARHFVSVRAANKYVDVGNVDSGRMVEVIMETKAVFID